MLKTYPVFKVKGVDKFYDTLPTSEKKIIKNYLEYRRARGVSTDNKIKDIRRYILHFRKIIDKNFNKVDLKDLRSVLALINQSPLSDGARNNLKIDIKNFLRYLFKDWSYKFNDFDDVKVSSSSIKNEKKINSKNMFTPEDIEKCMKHENSNYWKAFLMVQYEGALRTMETRYLKWNDIKFNVDGDISEINIYATKTKKARTIFIEKATYYLKKLKEEQENTDKKSVYCFHSKNNLNQPVDKNSVSYWFRTLTEKALGDKRWNYLLRHSRATELYRLAEQGKISKDVAIRFMGHSEDMSKVYTHLDTKEIKQMLKDQVYKIEDVPEDKINEFEKLKMQFAEMQRELKDIRNAMK